MNIILYNTHSPKNAINKILENPVSMNFKAKDIFDLQNPSIVLQSDYLIENNYCYIEQVNRYYFIDNVEVFPNKIYKLNLTCDVLETFKEDILSSKCEIVKQQDYNNYYDSDYASEIRKECKLFYSNKSVEYEENNIILTIGG